MAYYNFTILFFFTDEASDLEACQLLIDNASNLMSTIAEALNHTQSASIRIAKETREELGWSPPRSIASPRLTVTQSDQRLSSSESDSATGQQNQRRLGRMLLKSSSTRNTVCITQ